MIDGASACLPVGRHRPGVPARGCGCAATQGLLLRTDLDGLLRTGLAIRQPKHSFALDVPLQAFRDPGILPRNLDPDPPYPATSSADGTLPAPLPRDLKVRAGM